MRTARSWISAGYLPRRVIAPSSQRLEPQLSRGGSAAVGPIDCVSVKQIKETLALAIFPAGLALWIGVSALSGTIAGSSAFGVVTFFIIGVACGFVNLLRERRASRRSAAADYRYLHERVLAAWQHTGGRCRYCLTDLAQVRLWYREPIAEDVRDPRSPQNQTAACASCFYTRSEWYRSLRTSGWEDSELLDNGHRGPPPGAGGTGPLAPYFGWRHSRYR